MLPPTSDSQAPADGASEQRLDQLAILELTARVHGLGVDVGADHRAVAVPTAPRRRDGTSCRVNDSHGVFVVASTVVALRRGRDSRPHGAVLGLEQLPQADGELGRVGQHLAER